MKFSQSPISNGLFISLFFFHYRTGQYQLVPVKKPKIMLLKEGKCPQGSTRPAQVSGNEVCLK